jgi:chromosome partition protein MukF
LLDDTAATLEQLNELLLRHAHRLEAVLDDILELANAAEAHTAEAVTQRVMGQLDRVVAWGAARQEAWSEYYDYVHRYLRDVVRLDPARALTQRLREQLGGHVTAPFSLTVAGAPLLRVLRSVIPPAPPAPVRRPRAERITTLEEVATDNPVDALASRVREALAEGASDLREVTARVVAELPPEQSFAAAGRIAALAAELAKPELARERPWVPVRADLVIEDWRLEAGPSQA